MKENIVLRKALESEDKILLQGNAARDFIIYQAIMKYVLLAGTLTSGASVGVLLLKWLVPQLLATFTIDNLAVVFTLILGLALLWISNRLKNHFSGDYNVFVLIINSKELNKQNI